MQLIFWKLYVVQASSIPTSKHHLYALSAVFAHFARLIYNATKKSTLVLDTSVRTKAVNSRLHKDQISTHIWLYTIQAGDVHALIAHSAVKTPRHS
ncbi:hypothetical protein LENED_006774 [Lentinula edodes]|uniref:Uncharacterized protein n=1 Tax=Lentinula edodes TaxID=5353 RepID=A0A1Q3ECQ4_LENED|nr:hypothetical protein LENED_006774 [Lentinula edodes]